MQPISKPFSWTSAGEAYLATDAQVAAVAALPNGFSHATKDLTLAIANKTFPAWTLYVQTMELDANISLSFDPLDATKIWPEELFPLREVGRIVLNENIGDQFLENEQLAFSPSMVVPGESTTEWGDKASGDLTCTRDISHSGDIRLCTHPHC